MRANKDLKKHIHRFDDYDIIEAFKALGNKYRLAIILELKRRPDITLEQINQHVGGEFKNISFHTRKLFIAGLVSKKYKGMFIEHKLTEYGKIAIKAYELFTKDPF